MNAAAVLAFMLGRLPMGETAYGKLSRPQTKVLARIVKGREVVDFGSGDGKLSHKLVELGAAWVLAVDETRRFRPWSGSVDTYRMSFREFARGRRLKHAVGFVSWPWIEKKFADELLPILDRMEEVVVLAKNTDGIACGHPKFWLHMLGRSLLAHEPNVDNSLFHYGKECAARYPVGEEFAGLYLAASPALPYASIGRLARSSARRAQKHPAVWAEVLEELTRCV